MGLTGTCSNRTALVLADANRVRADLLALPGQAGPTTRVEPRPEPATRVIVEMLCTSDVPLGIGEVFQRAEQMLGRSVNRASLKAALAEVVSSENRPIRRVSRGRYESTSPVTRERRPDSAARCVQPAARFGRPTGRTGSSTTLPPDRSLASCGA